MADEIEQGNIWEHRLAVLTPDRLEELHCQLAAAKEREAALAAALHLTVAAMKLGADIGCVEDLDACDDGGEFWHNALRHALAALDAEEKA